VNDLLHFEDFHEGQIFQLGPHTVTRDDIVAFASEFDPQPFHLDEEAARTSILGGLSASGFHTASIAIRMICDAFLSRSAVLGSSGMDEIRWMKPVYADDELKGTLRIENLRPSSSRAERGIMKFTCMLGDRTGQAKCTIAGMFFMRRRNA
jgi:acyl dehydratase